MKKLIYIISTILLLTFISVGVWAAPEEPEITLQPQSLSYTEYGVAMYTVEVTGTNLSATWYMEWQGDTYVISNIGGSVQPWEGYAGESYGARQLDDNTFAYIFEGIGCELDGAYIWCDIEDGHYVVTSQKARITVGSAAVPPTIVDIPSQIVVEQGQPAEIRCVAQSPDGSQLSFLWYETDTGRMEDMRAVNRGTETSDYLICDTSQVGTRMYICMVETSNGGVTYSSIVEVVVTEKKAPETKAPETKAPETKAPETKAPETKSEAKSEVKTPTKAEKNTETKKEQTKKETIEDKLETKTETESEKERETRERDRETEKETQKEKSSGSRVSIEMAILIIVIAMCVGVIIVLIVLLIYINKNRR